MKSVLLSAFILLFPVVALAENASGTTSANDANKKNLLKPTNDPESWQLELTDGGKGDMQADGDAIVFHVTDVDDTNWHVQAYQTGLDLKNGKDYVIKFKLKAPQASGVILSGVINQEDWHEIGLHEELGSSKDFEPYEFTFTASDVADSNNRIGFVLGVDKGFVSVKDMTLMEK